MNAKAVRITSSIKLVEGMQIKVHPGVYPPHSLFIFTACASSALGGKPVHCAGILPGVSLVVHVLRPYDLDELPDQMIALWSHVQSPIEDWIEVAENFPCLTIPTPNMRVVLALDRVITLEKGVVQIDASTT